jgi:8-oxo-dGTP pyrophosphatase MutT (NUDIX family)
MLQLSKLPYFDPLKAPIVGVDQHLRPLGSHELSVPYIGERFRLPETLALTQQENQESHDQDQPLRAAAVLFGLVQRQELMVILTQRAKHLNTHSGQIAFPGGKVEKEDLSPEATALREAHEEVGLAPHHVQVLGRLNPLITTSAFRITPVVAWVDPEHAIKANANEVEEVFEVPLSFLMNPANHQRRQTHYQGQVREWYAMPYTHGSNERFIWGATANIIRSFYTFLALS